MIEQWLHKSSEPLTGLVTDQTSPLYYLYPTQLLPASILIPTNQRTTSIVASTRDIPMQEINDQSDFIARTKLPRSTLACLYWIPSRYRGETLCRFDHL